MLLSIVSLKVALRIVVAPRIKFRFKLRVEQSDTINTIIDKVQQYYINISSRITILKVKKLGCRKHAILQKLILTNESMVSIKFQSQSCWGLVLHAVHHHCQLRQKNPY